MPHTSTSPTLQDGDLLAAIDIGSNSFHMVIARYTLGQLRVVDRLRETVRMADGLDGKGGLSSEARQRALECLARFGQRIRDVPSHRVRALATNTVRQLRSPQAFLMPAETALGHAIEVVSGREEARLIYLGVAHAQPPKADQRRLVIDIGGGSTEFIIGSGMQTLERESLQAGCIASTRRFFPGGKLSRKRWKDALAEIGREFQPFASKYRALGWDEALGSSGTHKAISEICAAMKLSKGAITAEALPQLRDELLKAKKIDDIVLPGLGSDRRPIIAGGVLVLEAAFQALGLQKLLVSKAAMREGILYDIVGRAGENDPRDVSVDTLTVRYDIDVAQADRVQSTALSLFDQVRESWKLEADDARMLSWAARLHEMGLMIAHSGYHTHGSYLLENSDIAGFSRQEQQMLAALVRTHRRNVPKSAFEALPERLVVPARRLAALLRLAVLVNRAHESTPLPVLEITAEDDRLSLIVPQSFIDPRPLLRADLIGEVDGMTGLGLQFKPFVA
ncbi:exopolyphosphatase [Stenotrophomonas sp. Sa5BUN4]|jgi:exopolyphosphatase/guanosine-5'-triphosphate,3'-diphosphate pyrophosphatase|uniref:Exopolyphosphatase n=1 Tax=Stenotrophomonas lacuserhaii TaxID=2760084 RepID=A0A8X8G0Y0_9GAMM|nr:MULTISPECIES: exopolyphosphatase [Stenotrophomonas]MBD7954530.1 exopolyphosphatase [Stenotrophomonas pennii]MDX3930994.1 exopolyphosphatase [Stenotrophomonas sp.]PKH70924.1 exopolyphosphatase [Stenotrophomonas sp. Betaine-02u-23]PKH72740.1 exopolyphosphatase [Stenotrophomonas sp. Betaine-02u-21]PKH97085.1 exopolyphosphatase [Stenotrophomonas sp. Bg11-02]